MDALSSVPFLSGATYLIVGYERFVAPLDSRWEESALSPTTRS
jgi:hypothetical protein